MTGLTGTAALKCCGVARMGLVLDLDPELGPDWN